MALPVKIEELLGGEAVEWQRLELKEEFHAADILHTLCAFANDFHNLGGGYLVIGIEEKDGQPVLSPKGLSGEKLDGLQKAIRGLGHKIVPNITRFVSRVWSREKSCWGFGLLAAITGLIARPKVWAAKKKASAMAS